MTLEFREYKKKIKKNIFLELDFKVSTGEILTIISNNTLELDSLKDSFKRRTKFKGEITFDNIDINEEKLIFSEDFGFYNHLSLEKNLLSLSKILGLTVPKDDIIGGLDLLELDPNKKYQQLLENEKIKFHTLFSVLINQNILILDYSKDNLTKDDKKALRELILEHSNNANIIILDTILNQYNNIADNVLVISDGEKSYYGLLDDLLIIKKLAAISGQGVVVGARLLRVAARGTDPGGGDELHGPEHLLEGLGGSDALLVDALVACHVSPSS